MDLPRVAWLCEDALSLMIDEANRAGAVETGGVLLGYRTRVGNEPMILRVVGPGPNAVHESHRFLPDHEYQLSEIARLYRESGRRLSYLGDWHTHPGQAAYLSEKDKATLNAIAARKAARAPRPIMVILGEGPNWRPEAWGAKRVRAGLWKWRLLAKPLEIRVYYRQRD